MVADGRAGHQKKLPSSLKKHWLNRCAYVRRARRLRVTWRRARRLRVTRRWPASSWRDVSLCPIRSASTSGCSWTAWSRTRRSTRRRRRTWRCRRSSSAPPASCRRSLSRRWERGHGVGHGASRVATVILSYHAMSELWSIPDTCFAGLVYIRLSCWLYSLKNH